MADDAGAYLCALAQEMQLFDSHEHYPPEEVRTGQTLDFSYYFSNYCGDDFRSAGMTQAQWERFIAHKTPPEEKLALFCEVRPLVEDGCYFDVARRTLRAFFDEAPPDTLEDIRRLNKKIARKNRPGIYRAVQQRSHVAHTIVFTDRPYEETDFGFVIDVDFLTTPFCRGDLMEFSRYLGGIYADFAAFLAALEAYVAALARRPDVLGLKFLMAYYRDLNLPLVPYHRAEAVYQRLFAGTHLLEVRRQAVASEEVFLLQNYLVHHLIVQAGRWNLAVCFHTGLQAGMWNNLANGDPQQLWSLFSQYPQVRFLILHAGIPYCDKALFLAKTCPNVFVDMAWVHGISRTYAREILSKAVELLPQNKLLGFGGDYFVAEKTFGQAALARENVAAVLSEKVGKGELSLQRAEIWMRCLLHDNAASFYEKRRSE